MKKHEMHKEKAEHRKEHHGKKGVAEKAKMATAEHHHKKHKSK